MTRDLVMALEKRCITCGSVSNLQCGHLFTRSKYSVRWDLDNCHAQCPGCNLRHEYDPHVYVAAYLTLYGLDAYQSLYRRAETPRKWSTDQLEDLAMAMEEKLKGMQ